MIEHHVMRRAERYAADQRLIRSVARVAMMMAAIYGPPPSLDAGGTVCESVGGTATSSSAVRIRRK